MKFSYYRIQDADADIFETFSREYIGISPDDEMFEYVLEADDALFYDENGFEGEGIYWRGVCCCQCPDTMWGYIDSQCLAGIDKSVLEGQVVVEFEGEYISDCGDGDGVDPTKILRVQSAKEF